MLEGEDPRDALKGFQEVVKMEPERGEWYAQSVLMARDRMQCCCMALIYVSCRGFKALKQIVKVYYKLGDSQALLASYRCAALQICLIASSSIWLHITRDLPIGSLFLLHTSDLSCMPTRLYANNLEL